MQLLAKLHQCPCVCNIQRSSLQVLIPSQHRFFVFHIVRFHQKPNIVLNGVPCTTGWILKSETKGRWEDDMCLHILDIKLARPQALDMDLPDFGC